MEQKILVFMKENAIAAFAEADRTTGAVHIEKLGELESWDLFQQLVLYSDVETLCDSTRSHFPFQVWGAGRHRMSALLAGRRPGHCAVF